MDLISFCRALPKIELHAHLNGSLSSSTLLKLKRYYADSGIADQTDAFCDKFQIGAGDIRSFSDCFQVFSIAHSLTTTPEALTIATAETLKEFQEDGCCYIELRSTPRETPYMTRRQYINTIIQVLMSSVNQTMVSRLIISIDRKSSPAIVNETVDLAIEFHKYYPHIVVGIELSGDESIGRFQDYAPSFNRARAEGLKVTLHCGEVCHPEEVLAMLRFKPDRVGHAVFIHPRLGGTEETWTALRDQKIPVEVCLTSNVNTKSIPDYESHHFKELYQDGVPVIICTDDKGVFSTSLSQEYMICAETFNLSRSEIALLSLNACQHVFDENIRKMLNDQVLNFTNMVL